MEKMHQTNTFVPIYKKAVNVAISKALMTIFNIFGFSAYFSGLYFAWINVDVFTRTVMQLLGCVFLLFKIVSAIDNWMHKRKMDKYTREKEAWEKMIREEDYIRNHTKRI
jgi:uncharacterized membrane protein